jgi:sulfate adenylyltransferase
MVDEDAAIVLEMIATGVFSPLVGFMTREQSDSVVASGYLPDGTPWPIPFCFAPAGRRNAAVLAGLEPGAEVLLIDQGGNALALQEVEQVYPYDPKAAAVELFGPLLADRHPGVGALVDRMGRTALAGPVQLLSRPSWGVFERHRLTPSESYELLYRQRGFRTVAGFITGANPPHAGHEHMHRAALESLDALLLLPQVSLERSECVKDVYRLACLDALLDAYYPPSSVIVGALRNAYLFAGPREAVLHALVMRNYGCTHALIGRDHAGVGDLFDMYAGQRIFQQYAPGELGIETIFFSEVFYCSRCRGTATERTCAHDTRYRLQISGTGIREVLRRGFFPPKEVCRPEVSHLALQGVNPGAGSQGEATVYPAGQTIRSLFPFYQVAHRLGGHLRPEPLPDEALGERDLQAALLDARTHCDAVYAEVFDELAGAVEVNRSLAGRWVSEGREILRDHQTELLERLRAAGDRPDEEASAAERLAAYPRPIYPPRPPEPGGGEVSEEVPPGGEDSQAERNADWELPT